MRYCNDLLLIDGQYLYWYLYIIEILVYVIYTRMRTRTAIITKWKQHLESILYVLP